QYKNISQIKRNESCTIQNSLKYNLINSLSNFWGSPHCGTFFRILFYLTAKRCLRLKGNIFKKSRLYLRASSIDIAPYPFIYLYFAISSSITDLTFATQSLTATLSAFLVARMQISTSPSARV